MPDALADNPDTALELLEALVSHMGDVFELIRAEQRVSVAVPDAEIAADIWDLGAEPGRFTAPCPLRARPPAPGPAIFDRLRPLWTSDSFT